MNRFTLRQSLLLLLAATIWGVAFVAQSVGMDYVEPFTFNAIRCMIGGVVLLPCITLFNRHKKTNENEEKTIKKSHFVGGVLCGIILFIASNLQQIGLVYTSVGKAGFITAMYIIIVPILGIFFKRKVGLKIFAAVIVAVFGLYLLCMNGSFSIKIGDILVFLCAISFSFHILVVDHYSPFVDGVKMSCIQFFTCGILSLVVMFFFETPQLSKILEAWLPIVYAGVLSCGVAYTLQIIGQRGLNPTTASLIMSLESVISVLAGWIILGQKLSRREIFGCILMFIAIILAQLPNNKKVE